MLPGLPYFSQAASELHRFAASFIGLPGNACHTNRICSIRTEMWRTQPFWKIWKFSQCKILASDSFQQSRDSRPQLGLTRSGTLIADCSCATYEASVNLSTTSPARLEWSVQWRHCSMVGV